MLKFFEDLLDEIDSVHSFQKEPAYTVPFYHFAIRAKSLHAWRLSRIQLIEPYLVPNAVWLAGGALRTLISHTEQICDFDLFFKSEEHLEEVKSKLSAAGFKQIFACPKGELFTYKKRDLKVQCVAKHFYLNDIHLIDSFDFTICQAAYDGNVIRLAKNMIKSVKRKILYINQITYPVASINRMFKYKQKGYIIPEKTIADLVTQVSDGRKFSQDQMQLYID